MIVVLHLQRTPSTFVSAYNIYRYREIYIKQTLLLISFIVSMLVFKWDLSDFACGNFFFFSLLFLAFSCSQHLMTDLFSKPQESEENIILHKLPSPINVLSWLLSPSFALFTEQFLMKTVFQNCCASLVLLLFHCLVSFTGYFSLQICIYFFFECESS